MDGIRRACIIRGGDHLKVIIGKDGVSGKIVNDKP